MHLVYADEQGQVYDHPDLHAVARSGNDLVELLENELIPLPAGATLVGLPNTRAIGMDPKSGEMQALPGGHQAVGKPLPPDDMAGVPEELRLGFKLLKNAGMIPEEMLLRKEMVTLEDLLAACRDEGERAKLRGELSVRQLRYQSLMAGRGWQSSGAFLQYEQQIQDKIAGTDKPR